MGKYQLEYDGLSQLLDEFGQMDDVLKARIRETATGIGQKLKSNTESAIPRGAKAKHGTHLADDVKMSVKTTDTKATITVSGGKKTGGYWFIVDNGHVAKNGTFVAGSHFTDKAYRMTEVEEPVDRLVQEMMK